MTATRDRFPGLAARLSPLRPWWPPLAVAGLLVAAGAATVLSAPSVTEVPLTTPSGDTPSFSWQPPSEAPAAPPTDPGAASGGALPAWVMSVALLVCLVAAAAVVLPLLYLLLRAAISVRRGALPIDHTPTAPPAPRHEEVLAAVDAGLADLSDADRDPRRAVIACWVRLEQAAAAAGTPRRPGDTSTDLVLRLLDAHRVDRPVLDRFAALYREARYATHPVGERERGQARSALRQLRGELAAGAPAGVAP
ncbi:MAG TPA: DUF4129 domain-containing protein [Micromonosporaceae bacterium]|nr:DUF4129 domain-containing protein [Micromonosporaceae bacterium]